MTVILNSRYVAHAGVSMTTSNLCMAVIPLVPSVNISAVQIYFITSSSFISRRNASFQKICAKKWENIFVVSPCVAEFNVLLC